MDEPLHSVTTKDLFGLVTIHGETYAIIDIGMRMFEPRELYRAQGFPESYIIDRQANGMPLSETAQKHMCGNSVSPIQAAAIIRANVGRSVLYEVA
jgi:DNA (cytosine-5)-methyltransferase 1